MILRCVTLVLVLASTVLAQPVELSQHPPSGTWSAWLANGVRLHHKPVDSETVDLTISLFGGALLEDENTRGLTSAAASVIEMLPAPGEPDGQGRIEARATDDALQIRYVGDARHLEAALATIVGALTDPFVDPEALERWRQGELAGVRKRSADPREAVEALRLEMLYPDGERNGRLLEKQAIMSVTPDEVSDWLVSARSWPTEVAIVGGVDGARALESAGALLGQLPERERVSREAHLERRTIGDGPRSVNATRTLADADGAVVLVGLTGADVWDLTELRPLTVSGYILRLRLLEGLGDGAPELERPFAGISPGQAYPGYGQVLLGAETDPDRADELSERLVALCEEFAANGPTEEEVASVTTDLAKSLRDPRYEPRRWSQLLSMSTYRGSSPSDIADAPDIYRALTSEQVRAAFARAWERDGRMILIVNSKGE